ncbi:MAG: hypothetical protein SVS15_06050 [Thermodesulfobacteriota bacterium]|nr:hypothetical protein [Thermodesulfobacteriota bacterium]
MARAMAKAYARLRYDILCLTPREGAWLEAAEAEEVHGALVISDVPQTKIMDRGDFKTGFVIFPQLPNPYGVPDQGAVNAVTRAAKDLRPKVDLVVGLSPWGQKGEFSFFGQNSGTFDALLGSGPAKNWGHRPMAGNQTLWVRSEFDGRSIQRIEILARPGQDPAWQWKEGRNFRVINLPLDKDVPHDMKILNIFRWM